MPNSTEMDFAQCIGSSQLWAALDGDPLIGVMVVCSKGRIMHANQRVAEVILGVDGEAGTMVNLPITEALPPVAGELHLHFAFRRQEQLASTFARDDGDFAALQRRAIDVRALGRESFGDLDRRVALGDERRLTGRRQLRRAIGEVDEPREPARRRDRFVAHDVGRYAFAVEQQRHAQQRLVEDALMVDATVLAHETNEPTGETVKRPHRDYNQSITDFTPYQPYVDAWTQKTAKAKLSPGLNSRSVFKTIDLILIGVGT